MILCETAQEHPRPPLRPAESIIGPPCSDEDGQDWVPILSLPEKGAGDRGRQLRVWAGNDDRTRAVEVPGVEGAQGHGPWGAGSAVSTEAAGDQEGLPRGKPHGSEDGIAGAILGGGFGEGWRRGGGWGKGRKRLGRSETCFYVSIEARRILNES